MSNASLAMLLAVFFAAGFVVGLGVMLLVALHDDDDKSDRLRAAVDALDAVLGTDSDQADFDEVYDRAEALVEHERELNGGR